MPVEFVESKADLDFDAHMASLAKPAEDMKPEAAVTADDLAPEPKPDDKPKPEEIKPEIKIAAKPEDEITDPDTGDKIDLRTREGKRIQRLLERTKRAESETARLRSAIPAQPPAAKPIEEKTDDDLKPPNPADFTGPDAVDKYIDAKVDFKLQQALAADRAAQQKDRAQREATDRAHTIQTREAAFVTEHPDYYETLEASHLIEEISAGVAIFKHPTAQAIQDALHSEDGPALAYLLGKNPELHKRVATLSPTQALLVLGQQLQRDAKPPEKEKPKEERRSVAPPPPDVVEGRSSAADPDPMARDFDSHFEIENRNDAVKSRARRRNTAA